MTEDRLFIIKIYFTLKRWIPFKLNLFFGFHKKRYAEKLNCLVILNA